MPTRFTEVESGRRNDRPELEKALNLTRLTGATLVIAKLDWLSRNAAFLLTLQGSGVRFLACDTPEANDPTVGIMALVAQQERDAISRLRRQHERSSRSWPERPIHSADLPASYVRQFYPGGAIDHLLVAGPRADDFRAATTPEVAGTAYRGSEHRPVITELETRRSTEP